MEAGGKSNHAPMTLATTARRGGNTTKQGDGEWNPAQQGNEYEDWHSGLTLLA